MRGGCQGTEWPARGPHPAVAQPGTDASHPAFYLPGQELVGSNSHGTWTRDPCKPTGDPCSAGVDCCGGYCQPATVDGPLVCLDMLPDDACSHVTDKCSTADDCCVKTDACINSVCTVPAPN